MSEDCAEWAANACNKLSCPLELKQSSLTCTVRLIRSTTTSKDEKSSKHRSETCISTALIARRTANVRQAAQPATTEAKIDQKS